MDPYTPLFTLLRPGREHCKVAVECDEATPSSSDSTQEPLPSVDATLAAAAGSASDDAPSASADETATRRRIFALVTNVESGYEQACLFVLQRRSNDSQSARIVDGLPILPGFKASVRQVPAAAAGEVGADVAMATAAAVAAAANTGASSSSSSVGSASASSQLQLDMTLAGKTISAVSDDTQAIRDLTTVLRQLTGLAEAHDWTPSTSTQHALGGGGKPSHGWVEHYMHVERQDAADVSSAQTPIFSRFTKSAFAQPSPAPVRPYARPRDRSPGADEVKVSIGTFNVNGQVPDAATAAHLNDWLHAAEDEPDILVVGIEEADSSGLSYVVWTPHVEAAWSQAIARTLAAPRPKHHDSDDDDHHHADDAYVKLTSKQLVGVLIMVYVRTRLLSRIEDPAVASVGVGLGGWVANKGAAAVRIKIDATTMCFVVSHLSAFSTPDAVKRRRWDYHEIVRRLTFVWLHDAREEAAAARRIEAATTAAIEPTAATLDAKDTAAMSKLRAQLARSSEMSTEDAKQTPAQQQQHSHHIRDSVNRHVRRALADEDDKPIVASDVDNGVGHDDAAARRSSSSFSDYDDDELQRWKILDHDVVFWAGDLNWRVDLGINEVKRLIGAHRYEDTLLKFDQLRGELSAKASFVGFQEQSITFAPTYKYDRGTDAFDTSEKQRCPAWTDRVLWCERNVEPAANGVFILDESKKPARGRVQPLRYESAPSIRLSDHKPVLASFHVRTAGDES